MRQDLGLIDWILIVLALTPLVMLGALAFRRAAIRLPGGTVECSFRHDGDDRWRQGVVAYRTDQLFWFRHYGVGLRPHAAFDRGALQLVARHDEGSAPMAFPRGAVEQTVVVRFETGTECGPVWFALNQDALTGMLAWMEAGPQSWFRTVI
ncbi:MAG TPA: DUF2550 family protein [Streptosporangiaceae bacterium]|nr:DUF2550 family protein [Streptosporangiaceae bacterium]